MYENVKNNDIAQKTREALKLINQVQLDSVIDNPQELEKIRLELARLGSVIGQFESKAEYDSEFLDAARKSLEAKAFTDTRGIKDTKVTVEEAKQYATQEGSELRGQSLEARYQYKQLKNLKESIYEMCNAIASRLQTLRRDYVESK